jgi:hypothetical protein
MSLPAQAWWAGSCFSPSKARAAAPGSSTCTAGWQRGGCHCRQHGAAEKRKKQDQAGRSQRNVLKLGLVLVRTHGALAEPEGVGAWWDGRVC